MKTKTAINLLNRQLRQIDSLESNSRLSPQVDQWWRATHSVIAELYGVPSQTLSAFEAKLFYPLIFTTTTPDSVYQQAFLDGLADTKAFLQSLISEIQESGAYVLPVTEAELMQHYTGIFGAKVFWLAILTLAPILISLKLPSVGIHLSPAALVYAAYHGTGIYIWARVRQLSLLGNAPGVKHDSLIICGRLDWIVSKLAWLVVALLALTFLAKMQVHFYGSHSVPLPEWARQFVGVQ